MADSIAALAETSVNITLPYKIRPCKGKPDAEWVQHAIEMAKQNALSFNAKHDHGYIRIMVDEAEYRRITGEADDFQAPTKPAVPNHAGETSQVAVARAEAKYQQDLYEYKKWKELQRLIGNQIREAVDEAYIMDLKHEDLGWHNVTPKQIADHLLTTYGKVSSVDITKIEENMKKQWHPRDGPIEPYWKQLNDGLVATKHCTRGKITKEQALTYAIANFINSDVPGFKEAVKKFDNKPTAEQTLENLKVHINEAYNELPASDKAPVTTASAGYHSANNMENKENQPYPHYCWSHGVTWTDRHTSKTCHADRRFPNHNEEATFYNMCGGCSRIMRRRGDRAIWQPKFRPTNNGSAE